ncbi:MAG: chromate transporter [Oscillospiraceae bacterium]|nr:chromate transporter [Oscillospiraceae bacterium]
MILLRLFYEFFKVGLFAIGGGMATIPFLYDLAGRVSWFTASELTDMIAVSESTPGPIGINMATYCGFTVAGIPGAIIATVGLVTPSVIIIIVIAKLLAKFRNSAVDSVFYGLRPASVGLIAAAGVEVMKVSLLDLTNGLDDFWAIFNWKPIILAVFIFAAMKLLEKHKLHPLVYIAFSAVIGVIFKFAS